MMNLSFTLILQIALALGLLFIAWKDTQTFTITNRANIIVALGAVAFWVAVGLPLWPGVAVQLGVAAAVFVLLAIMFYFGVMGGGDVKLAAALSLWFRPNQTVEMLILMSLAGGVLTVLVMLVHKLRGREGKPEVPYGVAIAFGALVILTQRFLNHFA